MCCGLDDDDGVECRSGTNDWSAAFSAIRIIIRGIPTWESIGSHEGGFFSGLVNTRPTTAEMESLVGDYVSL
jgi:hypothetical protein